MQPGESKTLQWGLVSDEGTPLTLVLSAGGAGSELLSFPSSVNFTPHQLVYVNVTVTVPADHPNNVKLTPSIYATQAGATGGPTVLNVRMQKVLTINIGNPPIATPQPAAPVQEQNPTTAQNPSTTQSPGSTTIVSSEPTSTSKSTNINTKGGGCLIATAAFGSETHSPDTTVKRNTRQYTISYAIWNCIHDWF